MRRLDTHLDGPILLEPDVHGDARGFFLETARANTLAELGVTDSFVQDNQSRSVRGVLRGMQHREWKRWAPSTSTRSRGSGVHEPPSAASDDAATNSTRAVEIPFRSHHERMRSCSSAAGEITVCAEPAAAKTIDDAPAPVSNVVISGRSVCSSHSSAGQAKPK